MPDLERQLRELGGEAVWPATPDLATAVVAALPARRRLPRRRLPRRRLAVALAAALLLLPAAALAFPGPRHAILDALGLRHVTVERRPTPPAAQVDVRLGRRIPLARVPREAGFTPTYPAALGRPDRTYVLGTVVTALYDREHLLLAQAQGRLEADEVLHKILSVDDTIRRTTVNGAPAIWFPRPHSYEWTDVTGTFVRSGSALVWEHGGRVLRLEGARTLRDARRIAASVS
jgi:hypothetical protein